MQTLKDESTSHDPANLTGVPDEGPMLPAGSQLHLTQRLCFLEKGNLGTTTTMSHLSSPAAED